MPDTELLTDQQIAEIEARKVNDHHLANGTYIGCYIFLSTSERDSLIATVKQLRAERLEVQRALASSVLNDPTEDDDPPYTTTELVNGISNLIRRKESLLARLVAQRSSNKDLQSQLEQLRAENERLRESLATEVAKRVNVNVERMEQSREVSQSKLERTFDDRLSDTQRGSYD